MGKKTTASKLTKAQRVRLSAMLDAASEALILGGGPRGAYLAAAAVAQLPDGLFALEVSDG